MKSGPMISQPFCDAEPISGQLHAADNEIHRNAPFIKQRDCFVC
ncbi:hypothetical protein BF49_1589 [Bradyrhizobium sp.]|nr:hypothetical protein BF49_1589 [Bradyrhizobium sp.]